MSEAIKNEAKRCLQCKNPRCKNACPVNTAVPEFIKLFLDGEIDKSGENLFLNNPLSVVCSLVCPHERQCEGSCIKGIKSDPVNIGQIEHHISKNFLNNASLKSMKSQNKKVAIVGSGPSGITISFLLALKGYDITLFDEHNEIGGMLRYGIPDFRLSREILDSLKNKLINLGVKIRPNTLIGPVITLDDLFHDGYDAIFLGTGVWNPKKMHIPGESLGHVHFGIDYLKNPSSYDLGNTLCVIGAGNVAMDVARSAIRNGCKNVHVMYRKDFDDMSATKHEISCAKDEGVHFDLFKVPCEIVDEGLYFVETRKITLENGKTKLETLHDTKTLFEADSIIIAVSQGPRNNIVSNTTGIEIDDDGLVITNEFGNTTRNGVFACGDVVTGARTVVEAVKHSKIVANTIDNYIIKKYEK